MAISEQLRKAIRDSGESAQSIKEKTGVSQPTISRFLNGQSRITIDKADALAAYLGLELRPIEKPKRKP
jgi:transcriptional regulator with XRE-family HTH domain